MRKSFSLSPRCRQWSVLGCFFGVSLLLGSPTQAGATDVYTASYGGTNDTGGGAANTSGSYTLNTFTVTGFYTSNSTATEVAFITDGTANARIFGSDALFAGLTVGSQATATVTDSVYQGYEEFTAPTFTILNSTAPVTPAPATLSQVATQVPNNGTLANNPFTVGPSDSLYNSTNGGTVTEGTLLLGPDAFTITPTTSGALSTSGTTTLTDQTTGDTVSVYRSATALNYTAGQKYTLTGYEVPYTGASEIVGTISLNAVVAPPVPLYRQTTSGSWTASGGTDWSSSAAGPGNAGWTNDGTITAFFQKAPTGTITINAGNINATGLEFDVTGYTIASDGVAGDTLTLQNAGLVTVTNATDTATISAPVTGSAGITKSGAGTLILSGANTYTGPTTISAGTLQINADTALGAASSTLALAGGTLQSGLTTSGSNLAIARGITGGGGLGIPAGTTLTASGFVNAGTITLPGGGTLVLANTGSNLSDGASNSLAGLAFQTGGASLQAPNANNFPAFGVIDLNTGGITASQTSGAVSVSAIIQATGATVPLAVTNAGATLTLNGIIAGAGNTPAATTLVKTGLGTLVINSDNSGVAGAGTGTASFRQGTVGAANGGVVSIVATASLNPGNALGVGEFQANGGTVSNDTGAALTLGITDISLGAAASNPLVFAGANSITVAGPVTLYKGATNAYEHAITVNTPTTFSGIFGLSATATTSLGVTIAGSSTLTLSGTAPNTFAEPVTIATSGTGSGVILAKDGAFGANSAITLNAGATLTINTGVKSGTVNAINDAALVSFLGSPGTFGKLALNIGTGTETIGGLYLAAGDGVLSAGYQKAGVYGPTGSPAGTIIDPNLFSGTGLIMNLNAVPEPSTWATVMGGLLGLVVLGRCRRLRGA